MQSVRTTDLFLLSKDLLSGSALGTKVSCHPLFDNRRTNKSTIMMSVSSVTTTSKVTFSTPQLMLAFLLISNTQ